ncbi:MAG TPA: triose-phosphate isomerase [Anaerolineaceae bacterium]|nr:triose-phosphate isomerase [Anaerolineaceae bacterium]
MDRKPFVAGNWKMNKTVEEARQLVAELVPALNEIESVERVICPPFIALVPTFSMLVGTGIGLGAQNMYWENSGAYTGEVSPAMVREFCHYVILGHSERRAYFGETDETVAKKVAAAFHAGLVPIVCVGETLEENESNRTQEVVTRQLREGLARVTRDEADKLVIAYEPVWAIGTGRAASVDDARRVIGEMIRPTLIDLFGKPTEQWIRVLYGGSVNASNAADFFTQPEIDGALVGGASLKAGDFVKITQAAAA